MPIIAPHHKTGTLQQVYFDQHPVQPLPAGQGSAYLDLAERAAELERTGQLEAAMPLWQRAASLARDLRNRSWAILRAEHCQRHAKNPPLYLRPKPQEEAAA